MKLCKKLFPCFIAVAVVVLICAFALPTKAQAASESDLTFTPNSDGESYSVTGCDSLASGKLVIPATHNGKPVTSIGEDAFSDCTGLTSITIPDSVVSIGEGAFSGCSSLESITIPFVGGNRKTALDTYQYPFGYIFGKSSYTGGTATEQYYYGSSTSNPNYSTYYIPASLKSVTVTSGEILYGAFVNCSGLTSVTIRNGVTGIGKDAFYSCTGLTTITIGNSVTNIGVRAFYDCTRLTSVTIPDSVTSIGNSAFYNCASLTNATIGNGVTSIGDYAFNNCTSLTSVTIGNSVTTIGKFAFENCAKLTSISIPDSVTDIDIYAFSGCTSLISATIGNGVTIINYNMFEGCESLASVIIPDSVTKICNSAFENCKSLISITIPNSVTSIGQYAFSGCTNMTSVILGNSVTSIDSSVFENCKSLISITIPNSVTSIGWEAFAGCTSLTSVTIGNSVTSIGLYAFSGCTNMTSVILGNNVTTIDSGAFMNCESLTSITIPNSAASISKFAFSGCVELKTLIMGNSITSIDGCAFDGCNVLSTVFYRGTEAQKNNMEILAQGNTPLEAASWHYQVEDAVFAEQDCYYCAQCDDYFLLDGSQVLATITFLNWDGTEISTQKLPYNAEIAEPEPPNKPHNQPNIYRYVFIGWDNEVADCIGNATYTAVYEESYVDYTVIFENDDGTELSKKTYHWGDVVTAPANPTKAADNTYTYEFAGWDKEVVNCAGNATYTATYEETYINYTVIFVDADGTELSKKTYHWGDAVTAPTDPSKAADNTYTYTFAGWDKAVVNCAGNATYTATYTSTHIDYTVIFKDEDGTILSSKTYHYGDVVSAPADPPSATDYMGLWVFTGWDKNVVNCTGNVTYTATYGYLYYSIQNETVTITDFEEGGSSLSIPKTIEGLPVTSIGLFAFANCDSLTNVTIPDSVTSIGEAAFDSCENLTSVVIPDSVTSIGGDAFYGCSSLSSINIPDRITYIGDLAFDGCTNLAYNVYDNAKYLGNENNPYFVLMMATDNSISSCQIHENTRMIYGCAFSNCSNLTNITIPDNVTSIGGFAFDDCKNLTSIVIPDSVTSIGGLAFRWCDNLQLVLYKGSEADWNQIEISAINTDLTDAKIIYNFTGNSYDDFTFTVVFKDWDGTILSTKTYHYGEAVSAPAEPTRAADKTYIYTFAGWDQEIVSCVEDATYTAIYTSTYINYTVKFLDEDGSTLSEKTYHWGDQVTIPTNPSKAADNTYTYAFAGWDKEIVNCAGNATYTATYNISHTHTYQYGVCLQCGYTCGHNVKNNICTICRSYGTCGASLTWALDEAGKLTISGTGAMPNFSSPDSTPWHPFASQITNVTIGDSVANIGSWAFYDFTELDSVTIGNSVITIGEGAFSDCEGLTSITIPDSVTSIGDYAFYNCTKLTSITIPDSVTSIGDYIFPYCGDLTSITLPDSVRSIGVQAFYQCRSLTSVTIGNSITSISERMFCECTSLTNITIPDSVTSIGDSAFYFCTSLTSITIPDSVTTIDEDTFAGCEGLTCITIPDSITSIGKNAFNCCNKLADVYITNPSAWLNINFYNNESNPLYYADRGHILDAEGNEVTELVLDSSMSVIPAYAFSNCTNLTSITIPDSGINIDEGAFAGCTIKKLIIADGSETITANMVVCGSTLQEVVIPESVTSIGSDTFHYCPNLTSITIPGSITTIGEGAFSGCTGLTSVIYCGTQEKWDTISIAWGNNPLTQATRNYHNYKNGVCAICGYNQECTIIFKNWNGTIISSKTYHWGDSVVAPTNPTKAADNTYTYAFVGWDKDVVDCAGDATYTATYTSTYINYTVKFLDEDGSTISEKTYHWGDQVTIPTNPTKAADNTYTYTFAGWDQDVTACAGNATYTATFTATYIDYTVVFKNWDGSVISTKTYHYGDAVTAPSAPTRPNDSQYSYTFTGWDKTVVNCAGNATYTAVYSEKSLIPSTITSPKYNVSGGILSKVGIGTTAETLLGNLSEGRFAGVYQGTKAVAKGDLVGTGMMVKIMDGTTVKVSATVVVTGDINGDGKITITDMLAAKAHLLKKSALSGVYSKAADTNGDSLISITDFIQLKAHILGKSKVEAKSVVMRASM